VTTTTPAPTGATVVQFVAAQRQKDEYHIADLRREYRDLISRDTLSPAEQTRLAEILPTIGKIPDDIGRDKGLCQQAAALRRELERLGDNADLERRRRESRDAFNKLDAELKKVTEQRRLAEREFLGCQQRCDHRDQAGVRLCQFEKAHPELFS
jgi:hypothetical protein